MSYSRDTPRQRNTVTLLRQRARARGASCENSRATVAHFFLFKLRAARAARLHFRNLSAEIDGNRFSALCVSGLRDPFFILGRG